MQRFLRQFVRNRRFQHCLYLAVFLGGLASTLALSMLPVSAAADSSVHADYPQNGYYVDGTVNLQSTVSGLTPGSYEMFWAVDHGSWNRMDQTAGSNTSSATVNVSAWNWRKDNDYGLAFIALQKSNWQPIEQDITIHVGTLLTSQLNTASKPAATTAGNSPAAASPPAAAQVPAANLNGKKLYTDPTSDVARQATAWATAHPADAAGMRYLARQPLASWFGNWDSNVAAATKAYVDAASAANAVPVLVAYDIPQRDCGSYSAGGVSDAAAYAQWIQQFASGIGSRPAIVLLEPDAIADMDCLSAAGQSARLSMLKSAVDTLKSQTSATVYLDAGHPGWHPASDMAALLTAAGIGQADGFSLNISNFDTTKDNISYGTAISRLTGNAHFVIDTSRNGNGPTSDAQWCNPAGRSVGQAPTLSAASESGSSLVDAYLWVKAPGGSDGSCGPSEEGTIAPVAGAWWPQYAREMLLNSGLL